MGGRNWSESDLEYLRENYGNKSMSILKTKLKRTRDAIKIKATRIGLGGAKTNGCVYINPNQMAKILKIDRHKTLDWVKSGLMKSKFMELIRYQKIHCVRFTDFIEFLKNNQDLWDASRVDEYDLGYEYDWLINKREADKNRKNSRNIKKNIW